jgi:5-deoxy-glucuronate isomerase
MNSTQHHNTGPSHWKYSSPAEEGFHTVVSPQTSDCALTWIFRLNLGIGQSYSLKHDSLELNGFVVQGSLDITSSDGESVRLDKFGSFYIPAQYEITIKAREKAVLFIGGGPYEDIGEYFVRSYDPTLPTGEIRQLHGEFPFKREVCFTLNPEVPASRLVCGFTIGEPGLWTSWPPHQHTKDLEEVYCYFDIPDGGFALHLASRKPGIIEAVHPVVNGDCVIVPEGYHPTIGAPGVKSCYYWVMVSHSGESRRYDLAENDFFGK